MSKNLYLNDHKKNAKSEETLPSTISMEKDSRRHLAISPDSQQIVAFNPRKEIPEFKLYNINNLNSLERKIKLGSGVEDCVGVDYDDKRFFWSIAISNCVDDKNERLIALSCFDAKEFRRDIMHDDDENDLDYGKINNQYGDDKNDLESGDKINTQCGDNESDIESGGKVNDFLQRKTWIISTNKDESEIYTSLESIGGVIRFLAIDDSDDRDDGDDGDEIDSDDGDNGGQSLKFKKNPVIIIVNASGIFKETLKRKKAKQRFFSRPAKFKQFELPKQLLIDLSRDHLQDTFEFLHTSIIKNHFMVHSFNNRKQIIELYSLITGDLEILFKRHESPVAPNIILGPPISAISQNAKILAFCRGTSSITLYFIENGLEITTKQLESQKGIYKIVAMKFIDEDNKLLIVLEEKEYQQVEIHKRQIFVVWDLFTTFENSIRQIDYSEIQPLKMDVTHRLKNSHEKMFAERDDGSIFSVLDHKDVDSIRNSSVNAKTKIDITTWNHVDQAIYNINGERCDALKLIINNVEPWYLKKNHFRISVYLDSSESTQLIISKNTIQVWKYRKNTKIETRDKRDRVLEYIWARKKVIEVKELRIGKREFVIKVLVLSTSPSTQPKPFTIHWPNNVNVLEGACRTLYVLGEKKHDVIGNENVYKFKYLVECTQRLVRKYITKYGIFRLTSIRYPIMKYLIKSSQESLINYILNNKINRKNSNIYIPRLYKWANNRLKIEISKSDLYHAVSCIQKRGDSTVILKYLIDYYADNAKEYNNHGWMLTVSKAIPLLYDSRLREFEFVQYLFKKPCFGITEAYTPPLHIDPYDQRKGNNAAVLHSLSVKPRLALKIHNTSWVYLKSLFLRFYTSHNDHKVYMVPLSDFTVYPNPKAHENHSKWFRKVINETKKMSPFLRVILEEKEKGYEIYQTPTIMAVLDFKWSSARRYFIRHIIMYILYAISCITVIPHSFNGELKLVNFFKTDSRIILTISLLVYLYTGWYLIVTEIVQLKREGLHRYINIYNIFDIVSLLLPLADNIACILYSNQLLVLQNSVYNSVLAFTALVMWLQLLLLLRHFEGPGRFIYIIISVLNTIWPFFAFMLIAILAFGHAMFILLNYADDSSLQIPTYKINDTSNPDLYSNITIYQNIDKSSRFDNYYSNLYSSVEAVFFWTNGRWDQLDQWNNYAVNVISILGSITLVLIFQNMLIAFMNGTFNEANKAGRTVAHRYRAELIAEYEALEKPFDSKKGNPRYIYYIPDPDVIDTWLMETKKVEKQKLRLMGENLAELTNLTDFNYSDDDNEDDDDDYDINDGNQDNSSSKKDRQHIQNEGSSSTCQSSPIKCNDKITFTDEEIYVSKVTSFKSKKKSQRNLKSNNKLSKNNNDNDKSSNKDQSDPTINVNVVERFNNLDTRFNNLDTRFNNLEIRFDELEQNLKTILKTLNNLYNDI
ncbi:hypothetical protein Glove_271g80 [Diversispora epigaea]|uniref:Ion transport domain-containing protein n=1 Tax=Diversispora epigaea TaxID=1348612 RepID=A0A397I6E4_9GLOM|nr:hypothetical protein Glove_271g80 [Diversispora epigaea]